MGDCDLSTCSEYEELWLMSLNPKQTMNISNFLSRVKDRGFARQNRIAVTIRPPIELVEILNYKDKDNYLTYYAEQVSMPSFDFNVTNFEFGGPTTPVPTKSDFKPVSVTFLLDDDMRQKMFFDAWINYINPKENKFDFRYRDDYVGSVDILQLSENGKGVSYGVRLFDAYPNSIGQIDGTWAEQEVCRLNVVFTYRYWRSFNADRFERDDSDAPDLIESIDVIGQRRDAELIESIDVVGRRRGNGGDDLIESIDVIGTRRNRNG
jgi:hypothetical protein